MIFSRDVLHVTINKCKNWCNAKLEQKRLLMCEQRTNCSIMILKTHQARDV